MTTTEINDAAVDAAYGALYGDRKIPADLLARVKGEVRKALAAAAPHLLSDPGEKKLGPFVKGSDTSRLAALAAYPTSDENRRAVLRYVAACPASGATREEIAVGLEMNPNTVRPRVAELRQGGWLAPLIANDGKPVRRATAGGRTAEVLIVSEIGRRRLAQREAA